MTFQDLNLLPRVSHLPEHERLWEPGCSGQSLPSAVFFWPRCRALRQPMTNHKRQIQNCCETSGSFSGKTSSKKIKFVAESRTQVHFAQHVASTCNAVRRRLVKMNLHFTSEIRDCLDLFSSLYGSKNVLRLIMQ